MTNRYAFTAIGNQKCLNNDKIIFVNSSLKYQRWSLWICNNAYFKIFYDYRGVGEGGGCSPFPKIRYPLFNNLKKTKF